jgi:hypothetical protein
MAQQKKVNSQDKPVGKKGEVKKHLIDPKYKNTFWTVITLVVLTIFFIINNTKSVQERGPYPPNYSSYKDSIPKSIIDSRISLITTSKDSVK